MNAAELRARRSAVGLSVSDLADHAGVDARTVRRWEAGHREMGADTAARVDGLLADCERSVDALEREFLSIWERRDVVQLPAEGPDTLSGPAWVALGRAMKSWRAAGRGGVPGME